ncbi:MAG: cob(I)yrinic acid a,c-diamide adenosyltransferase [Bacteroidota bacterium]
MKIYTKKGDAGKTSLLGGTRVSKDDLRIEAYGTVDELNAHLGWLGDQEACREHLPLIRVIQEKLFLVGSLLANDPEKSRFKLPELTEEDVFLLEKSIDNMNEALPPLKNFILPGGHPANSGAHLARTVCRRAERRVVTLDALQPLQPEIMTYLNRLSDWLFVLGRVISHEQGAAEIPWTLS